MKPKLRVLDLFSGIGGFSLGLERTGGFETVAFCEIEEFPRRVLAKHWPEVKQYNDVRTLTKDVLDRDGIAVDIITGGFPCQDISTAGKQAGISSGTRSGLWFEIARLVFELKPQFAVIENVSAIRSKNRLAVVMRDLAQIGYDAVWHFIPASNIGAPHERDRAWIVAYPSQIGRGKGGKAVNISCENVGQNNSLRTVPFCPSKFSAYMACVRNGKWTYQWPAEPSVGRVVNGLSGRVDRVGALGNAVVPQIPELIGNAILDAIGWRESEAA